MAAVVGVVIAENCREFVRVIGAVGGCADIADLGLGSATLKLKLNLTSSFGTCVAG